MALCSARVGEEIVEEVESRTGLHLRHGPEVNGAEAVDVWYFAFGSNMNEDVLRGRRMVVPAEAIPAKLPGYRLVFSLVGLPYREPAFASVEPVVEAPSSQAESNGLTQRKAEHGTSSITAVHGVLFRLTPSQWAYVCETEGAAGTREASYAVLDVIAETYSGHKIAAHTLTTSELGLKFGKGRTLHPSRRYMGVIRRGALNHGLDQDYLCYLDRLPVYTPKSLGQKVMHKVMLTSYIAIMAMFAGLRLYRRVQVWLFGDKRPLNGRASDGHVPPSPLFQRGMRLIIRSAWVVHDVISPIMGSGAS